MVAVPVGDEHRLDVGWVDSRTAKLRDESRRRVDEQGAIDEYQ
jgi:hypothetical protein